MEGGMDLVSVQLPRWYSGAIFFNLGYLFALPVYLLVMRRLTSRRVDARLVTTFPIVVTVAVSAFAVSETLQFMRALGENPRTSPLATAGSVALAIGPLLYATAVAGLVSLLVRFTTLLRGPGATTSRAGSLVLSAGALMAIFLGGLMWYLTGVQPEDVSSVASIATALYWFATLVAVLAVGVLFLGGHEPYLLDRWLVAFAVCCAIGFTTMWVVQERLERYVAAADINGPR